MGLKTGRYMPSILHSLHYRQRWNSRRYIVGIGLAFVLVCLIVGLQLATAPGEQPEAALSSVPRPRATVHPAAVVHGPVRVSANGRYLIDRQNRPFLIVGDAPQALIVNLSE